MLYCVKLGSEVGSLNVQPLVSANPAKKKPDCLAVHLFYGERINIF